MDDILTTENDIASFLLGQKEHMNKVKKVKFSPLQKSDFPEKMQSLLNLRDLKLTISAELGKTIITVRNLLELKEGDVLELDKPGGEMTDIYLNEQKFAQGEVLVINEVFGVRLNFVHSIKNANMKEEI